jgi:hypothetical protein
MYLPERGLVLERLCEDQQKLLERREIFTLNRRLDHRLDAMIARYEGRIDRAHPGATIIRIAGLSHYPCAPPLSPYPKLLLITKQASKRSVCGKIACNITQPAERQCEVNLIGRKQAEEFAGKLQIAICLSVESQLFPHAH